MKTSQTIGTFAYVVDVERVEQIVLIAQLANKSLLGTYLTLQNMIDNQVQDFIEFFVVIGLLELEQDIERVDTRVAH
jgi:hypothetical protein